MRKIIAIIIIVFVTIGLYILLMNIKSLSKQNSFTNNLLGFEINYGNTWRISERLSKKYSTYNYTMNIFSEMGCTESLDNFLIDKEAAKELKKKDEDCLKNHPQYNEYMYRIGNFVNTWKIENSDYTILTNWSNEEEDIFFMEISKGNKSIGDILYPEVNKSTIMIYPSYSDMSFIEEKSSSTEKNGIASLFERKIINLPNNIRAYSTNINGDTLVFVPRSINTSSSTSEIKGLLFNTGHSKALSEILTTLKFDK